MITRKKIVEAGITALFIFAKERFGVEWNAANDIFFTSGVLSFNNTITKFRSDVVGSIDFFHHRRDEYFTADYAPIKPMRYQDIPKEYFDAAPDHEKANIMLLAFFEENGIQDNEEVYIQGI